jgi:hypothetical protein
MNFINLGLTEDRRRFSNYEMLLLTVTASLTYRDYISKHSVELEYLGDSWKNVVKRIRMMCICVTYIQYQSEGCM